MVQWHWHFVAAAYGITALLSLAVLGWSWRVMRRAEAQSAALFEKGTRQERGDDDA